MRELENVLERSLILNRSDILEADSLPPHILGLSKGNEPTTSSPPQVPVVGFTDEQKEHSDSSSQGTASDDYGSQAHLLEHAEKAALIKALTLHNGHREKTAESLGMSRRTLQYKLKKYGLNKR